MQILTRLLSKRFGSLPDWATQKLAQAEIEDLEAWGERMLDANSLEDVVAWTR